METLAKTCRIEGGFLSTYTLDGDLLSVVRLSSIHSFYRRTSRMTDGSLVTHATVFFDTCDPDGEVFPISPSELLFAMRDGGY